MYLIKSMCEDIKMAVKLPGGLTTFFESVVGVRQGCNRSPMLFKGNLRSKTKFS